MKTETTPRLVKLLVALTAGAVLAGGALAVERVSMPRADALVRGESPPPPPAPAPQPVPEPRPAPINTGDPGPDRPAPN